MRMRRALDEYRVIGLTTTVPLHQQIMDSTEFILAQYNTSWLEEGLHIGHRQGGLGEDVAVAVATLLAHQRRQAVLTMQAQNGGGANWKLRGRLAGMRS